MEYLMDLRFEDQSYNALIHFVSIFQARTENEAKVFLEELLSGFRRRGIIVFSSSCYRIDIDATLKARSLEYCNFIASKATASIKIEQFILEDPNQLKSLSDNLIEKFFNGTKSIAFIGNKYNLPVRVLDKGTRNPISGQLFYSTIEHLIPIE